MLTVAPAIGPPSSDVTTPVMRPDAPCARSVVVGATTRVATPQARSQHLMLGHPPNRRVSATLGGGQPEWGPRPTANSLRPATAGGVTSISTPAPSRGCSPRRADLSCGTGRAHPGTIGEPNLFVPRTNYFRGTGPR